MSRWVASAAAVLSLAVLASAQQVPGVETIIQRSVQANALDWKASPEYDCFERDLEPGGHSKTFENLMIFGSPFQVLMAVDGTPIGAEERSGQKARLQAEISRRRQESTSARKERITKYERDRERDHQMMEQLTKAFTFSLLGERKLGTNNVYLIQAAPKPDYQPPNLETQALKGMEGRLWVDQQSFQWVRVEAQVIRPVAIEGFLAQVEPGTRFELEKTPVAEGIWLPKHYSMKAQAKVLFLFPHESEDDETYYGCREASTDPALHHGTRESGLRNQ